MADRVPASPITLQWRARASFNVEANQLHITIPILMIFNVAHDFTSRHSLISFIIPTLLAFLQLQTLGSQPPPFLARPVTASASVIGVLGYYLSSIARRYLPDTYASQLIFAKSLLGSFSVASLVSLLLPSSLWNLRFAFYVLLMLPEYHPWLKKMYDRYVRRHRQPPRTRVALPCLMPQTSIDFTGLYV